MGYAPFCPIFHYFFLHHSVESQTITVFGSLEKRVLFFLSHCYSRGLTPSSERNSSNTSNNSRVGENLDIQIGDTVSLCKHGRNETGTLVFNDRLQQFGVVMQQVNEEVG